MAWDLGKEIEYKQRQREATARVLGYQSASEMEDAASYRYRNSAAYRKALEEESARNQARYEAEREEISAIKKALSGRILKELFKSLLEAESAYASALEYSQYSEWCSVNDLIASKEAESNELNRQLNHKLLGTISSIFTKYRYIKQLSDIEKEKKLFEIRGEFLRLKIEMTERYLHAIEQGFDVIAAQKYIQDCDAIIKKIGTIGTFGGVDNIDDLRALLKESKRFRRFTNDSSNVEALRMQNKQFIHEIKALQSEREMLKSKLASVESQPATLSEAVTETDRIENIQHIAPKKESICPDRKTEVDKTKHILMSSRANLDRFVTRAGWKYKR